LVTNLSKEPKWITEFFRCNDCGRTFDRKEVPPPFCPNCSSDKIGDLHSITAMSLFGEDARMKPNWKFLRQISKSINFGLCYGGGGEAVRQTFSKSGEYCSKEEGWRIKHQFDKTYPTLKAWWGKQHDFARRNKLVLTAFGRKYPLPDIDHENGFFRSKAERNAVNGPIQGTSADLTKAAMAIIFKEFQKRGWLEKCMLVITMHDELCFECDGDILEEAITVISDIMVNNNYVRRKKWIVSLPVDVEAGFDWSVKWNITEIRHGQAECPDALRPFLSLDKKYTPPIPGDGEKQSFSYRLKDLSDKTNSSLMEVILGSLDDDGLPLEVVSPRGDNLSLFLKARPVVDPGRFKTLAQDYGI